jgi:hypothetical protein
LVPTLGVAEANGLADEGTHLWVAGLIIAALDEN